MYTLTLHNEMFLTFKSLKDFNRYSKKWLSHNFKDILNNDHSERLKVFIINYSLPSSFYLYYEEEKQND